MSCVNPNNPVFQSLVKKLGSFMLAEVEFSKIQQEDFVIQNNGTFLALPEEKKREIYDNYVTLMGRKREGKEVTYKKFEFMFDNLQVFKYKNSYIFGEWDSKNNVFRGRLISSPSLRELLTGLDILTANVDFMASVPEDIGSMLDRKGMVKIAAGKDYNFRGEEMVKNLYFSSEDVIRKVFNTDPRLVSEEAVKKYDTFFNYWSLIKQLQKAYDKADYDSIYPLLTELGIYDYNAYKTLNRFKQLEKDFSKEEAKLFKAYIKYEEKRKKGKAKPTDVITLTSKEKQRLKLYQKYIGTIKDVKEQLLKNSASNLINIDKTDLINNPKIYDELNNDLNKTLARYLSKFGIKTETLDDIQTELGIDSLAHLDILNKMIYTSKTNQQDYPQKAGKLIAYMMQHNPLVNEITSKMKKMSMFKDLTQDELLDAVGDLISQELHKKTKTDMPKDLIEAIRNLIRQFFLFLNNLQISRINRNVGIIADNILLENQSLITQSVYKPGTIKPVSKIGLEEALKSDKFGNDIIEKLSKDFILTGSITLSEQGSVYRPNENQIHDIDWVSPHTRAESIRMFNEAYPKNEYIREIVNDEYTTDTWLIAPEGYEIVNLQLSGGNNKILGYDIVNSKGKKVSSYIPEKDSHTGKIEAKLIDIFSYEKPDKSRLASRELTLLSGTKLQIADWRNTFRAKLEFGRLKDIWDYNRYIPYDYIYKPEPDITEIPTVNTEPGPAITEFYNGLSDQDKNVLGNLEELIAKFEDAPYPYPVEQYIESLKCKL